MIIQRLSEKKAFCVSERKMTVISTERLRERFEHMKGITDPGRGVTRLAFTDSDWRGRAYIISLMEEAGLTVREDAFGNVIGRRAGLRDDLPAVAFGSHGDSVPEGGNFDGLAGVLSAAEVMQSLREEGFQNERPLEMMLFMCEESSRFGAATLGSRAMCGELTLSDLFKYHDREGRALYDVLKKRGLDPDHVENAYYKEPPAAFFEVHIEQGRVLEHEKKQLGVVTGIAAPTRLRISIRGTAAHSGGTPMHLRHDGLAAAAEIILTAEWEGLRHTDPMVVATVSTIRNKPNVINVVPGEVTLGVDVRSISREAKHEAAEHIMSTAKEVCRKRGVGCECTIVSDEEPAPIRKSVIDFLGRCCMEAGRDWMRLPSGAGHDSMHWAMRCPTGMIFLPCKNGVSHNFEESAEIEDVAAAAGVLERAVREASRGDFHL